MQGDSRRGNGFVCQGATTQKLICSDTLSKRAHQPSHGSSYRRHMRFKGARAAWQQDRSLALSPHTHTRGLEDYTNDKKYEKIVPIHTKTLTKQVECYVPFYTYDISIIQKSS